MNAKLIVIASTLDDVIIVTPRSPHAARGIEADSVTITTSMLRHDATLDLLDEIEPCTVTSPDARAVVETIRRIITWRPRSVL